MQSQRIEIGSNYMRSVHSRMLEALPPLQNGEFIISERTLRLEAELIQGKNTYEIPVVENKGSDRPLERKLNRNDGFVLSHIGFALTKQDTTKTPQEYGNFPLFTNPDPNYFVGLAGGDSEASAIETPYNGDLSLKVNNTEIIQEFAVLHTRYVPERGYTRVAAPQIAAEYPQYGPGMEERGFYPYSISSILNGQDNNIVKINLGAGNTSLIAGGVDESGAALDTRNVIVIFLHGYEIAEAAQAGLRWGTF